jgi:hypothetical protein
MKVVFIVLLLIVCCDGISFCEFCNDVVAEFMKNMNVTSIEEVSLYLLKLICCWIDTLWEENIKLLIEQNVFPELHAKSHHDLFLNLRLCHSSFKI